MDLTHAPPEPSVTDLARVGAELDFAVQRFAYLRQHPDGRSGQPFLLDNAVAFSMSLILGALLDLILDVRDGHLPYGKQFDAQLTPEGMDIILHIERPPNEFRSGYRLIRSLASSVTVDDDGRRLVIKMSAASITSGFPEQDPSVCPPSVAG
jgi:hypothetical protein